MARRDAGSNASGAAYCWGDDRSGQLGDGSTTSPSVPVAVSTSGALAGKKLIQVTTGGINACALDSGGAAYCWGSNEHGQLGDVSTVNSSVPVAVSTSNALAGKSLTQISAEGYDTCAADRSGTDYCWGLGTDGVLGVGGLATSDAPLAVVYPPADVTVTPGQGSALVSWATAASLGGGTLASYIATASPGGESCTTTTTSCTIPGLAGLADGLTYTVAVITVVSSVGGSGPSTPPVSIPASDGPVVSDYHKTACLDDPGYSDSDGTNIVMWECDGANEQNWTVKKDGTIRINGKCLDVYLGGKASKTPVDLATCTGNAQEQWQAVNGTLVNPRSSQCLDDPRFNTANGTPLEIYACNGGANQQWELP